MPTSTSKRPDILQVTKQLQHARQDDPAVVESMARAVMAAVAEQGRVNSLRPPGRLTRREANQMSAYLVASFQCAAWLQQAARGMRVPVRKATDAADAVAFLVMSAATKWVMMVDMNLDFLRAVVRPALGGTAPGKSVALRPSNTPTAASTHAALHSCFTAVRSSRGAAACARFPHGPQPHQHRQTQST